MNWVEDVPDLDEVDWELLAANDPDPESVDLPVVDRRSPGQILDEFLFQDCAELDADEALEVIQGAEWLAGCVQAVQYAALARFAKVYPEEFAAAELGPALGWSRQSSGNRLARAEVVTDRLPGALAALRRGALDFSKTSALVDLTTPLSDVDAAAVARRVLPGASEKTLRQFGKTVRVAVQAVDPRGAAERARDARRDRRVCVTPLADGVSELFAVLKSEDAAAVSAKIEKTARELTEGTLEQRRADALVALILGTKGADVVVNVTVPVDTLIGSNEQSAELSGYGPIPAQLAREIAADGTWRRILTDPVSDTVLDYGRDKYTPPKPLREHVIARDRTCRFPGCEYPAEHCDIDHTQTYENGGTTSANNLGSFCRHHHRVKHSPGWTVAQPVPGEFHFTSPLGRTYTRSRGFSVDASLRDGGTGVRRGSRRPKL